MISAIWLIPTAIIAGLGGAALALWWVLNDSHGPDDDATGG